MVDLTGKKEADAKSTLSDLKLVANVGYTEDNSKDDGVVLKQSVEVGKVVDEGTTVTITVNKVTETKNATVTVDVKSLTGGYSNGNEIDDNSKTVTVELKYGDKTETRTAVDKNKKCQIQISGKNGETANVQVAIKDKTGTIYSSNKSIKFGSLDELVFSK